MFDPSVNDNNRKSKRELVLELMDNKRPLNSIGQVDPRVFKGGNKVYLVQDVQYMLWYFKYESGIIPGGLNQKFTRFDEALEFAKKYFKSRNLKVVDVID